MNPTISRIVKPRGSREFLVTWGIPLLIAVSFGALALSSDLLLSRLLPAVVALVVCSLGFALRSERRQAPRWSPAAVLVLAAVFRLLFLFRPPELSDDVFRYLWDGEATLSGENPYASAPAQVDPANRDLAALKAKVNHPELVTIYPPAAQIVFAVGRMLSGDTFGLKALLCVLDMLTCLVLLQILRRLGLPSWRLALYAWHPLPVLELAGSGHIDGAAVFFLFLSISLLMSLNHRMRNALVGGAALAASILTKLLPLILLPSALALAGRRRSPWFLAALVATAILLIVPFLPDIRNGFSSLSAYAHRWEFAGFAFRSLRRWTGSGDLARALLAGGFLVSCLILFAPLLRRTRDADSGPDGVPRTALRVGYGVALAFLLFTPTLFAWYALYLAAFLPFAAGPAGMALSASVFLGYRVLARFVTEGQWVDSDGAAAAIVLIPLAAFLFKAALDWRSGRARGV